jgi:hypothetical protein
MRLPAGQRGLLGFGLLAGVAFVVTLYLIPSAPPDASEEVLNDEPLPLTSPEGPLSNTIEVSEPRRVIGSEVAGSPVDPAYRGYSLPLSEIRGLGPDALPGDKLDLWVAWDRPITRGPRVQRLLTGAVIDQMVPPVAPEGPVIVELLIPVRDLPDFLFAHRYGSLSAVSIP